MIQAFVCLGANMGDAETQLARARTELAAFPGVHLAAVSSIYRTEPQGRKNQPWFLNQVIRLDCPEAMTPECLLEFMLAKELEMGRVRDSSDHFGPRAIDMDLLLFGKEKRSDNQHLELPHPRMAERAFVLIPLNEIAPGLVMPDGRSIRSMLDILDYRLEDFAIFQ